MNAQRSTSDDSPTPSTEPSDRSIYQENELEAANTDGAAVEPPPGQRSLPLDLAGIIAATSSSHSGPLPPASEFARYETVLPGAADRILSMAESALRAEIDYRTRTADHSDAALRMNHELDVLQLQARNRSITRAQWMTLAVLAGVFSLAAYAVNQGQALAGILIAIAALTGLVAILFRAQASRKQAIETDDTTDAESPKDESDDFTS